LKREVQVLLIAAAVYPLDRLEPRCFADSHWYIAGNEATGATVFNSVEPNLEGAMILFPPLNIL